MSTKKKVKDQEWVEAVPFLEKLTGGPLTFARMLWSIRRCDEMSQVEMAQKLGISKANLCDIEKGRKAVSPSRAAQWARTLGYSEIEFVRLALEDLLRQSGLKMVVHVEDASRRRTKAA